MAHFYAQELTQSVADTLTAKTFRPPTLSPQHVIRADYAELEIYESHTWAAAPINFKASFQRVVTGNKMPVGLLWHFTIPISASGAVINNILTWNPPSNFPLLMQGDWELRLTTTGTGIQNRIDLRLYYESVLLTDVAYTRMAII